MADVFRIITAEGHQYDYHRDVDQLKQDYPGAVITGRRVMNDVGEGTYEPYSIAKAQAAKRKAADDKAPKRKAANDEPQPLEAETVVPGEPAEKPSENGKP